MQRSRNVKLSKIALLTYLVAIITSGAYLGNLINMGMVHAPYWQSLEPIDFMEDFKSKFDLLVSTLPVTRLPSLIAIIAAIWLSRKNLVARKYWMYSLIPVVAGFLLSAIYFLPTNVGFVEQTFSPQEAAFRLQWWFNLHWLRVVFAIISSIYAVLGFKAAIEHK